MSRRSINSSHLVSFRPQVTTADADGAKQYTYAESSQLQCRIVQGTSDEQVVATQREWESTFTVWTVDEPPWNNHDFIKVLGGPTFVGLTMECRGKAVTGAKGKVWHTTFFAAEYRQQLTGANLEPPAT